MEKYMSALKNVTSELDIVLRDYQADILKQVFENFENNKSHTIALPNCGGKTILSFILTLVFLELNKKVLLYSPSKQISDSLNDKIKSDNIVICTGSDVCYVLEKKFDIVIVDSPFSMIDNVNDFEARVKCAEEQLQVGMQPLSQGQRSLIAINVIKSIVKRNNAHIISFDYPGRTSLDFYSLIADKNMVYSAEVNFSRPFVGEHPKRGHTIISEIAAIIIDKHISMPDKSISAYNEDEPYIFISYSHDDEKAVYSIIKKLQESGCRVWFDGGIKHGNDWRAFIENRIISCECFIAMISKNFFASKWCSRELKYADENNKTISCIYLDNVEIPKGTGIGIIVSDVQATKKYEYADENNFYNKVLSWNELEKCRGKLQEVIAVKDEFMNWIKETKISPEAICEAAVCEFEKLLAYINEKENLSICIKELQDLKDNEEVIFKYINNENDEKIKMIYVKICEIAYTWMTNFFNKNTQAN